MRWCALLACCWCAGVLHAAENFPLAHFWNPKVPRVVEMDGSVTLTVQMRKKSPQAIGPLQCAVNAREPDQFAMEILDPVIGSIASYQCADGACQFDFAASANIPHAPQVKKMLERMLAPLSARDLSRIFRGTFPVVDAAQWQGDTERISNTAESIGLVEPQWYSRFSGHKGKISPRLVVTFHKHLHKRKLVLDAMQLRTQHDSTTLQADISVNTWHAQP